MSEFTTGLKSIEFTWKVTNFSRQKLKNGPGKFIRSQAFPIGCEGDLKFTLIFYQQGYVQSGETEWASLYLNTEGGKKYDTSHLIEFSVLDKNGEIWHFTHAQKNSN
jgi:hypothetical protein